MATTIGLIIKEEKKNTKTKEENKAETKVKK